MDLLDPVGELGLAHSFDQNIGPVQLASAALENVQKPFGVEQTEVVTGLESALDRILRVFAAAPKLPPVGELAPTDDDVGGDALFERRIIDVACHEGVVNDGTHPSVVVAHRRLAPANSPRSDDRSADLARQEAQDAVFGARLVVRKEVLAKIVLRANPPLRGSSIFF